MFVATGLTLHSDSVSGQGYEMYGCITAPRYTHSSPSVYIYLYPYGNKHEIILIFLTLLLDPGVILTNPLCLFVMLFFLTMRTDSHDLELIYFFVQPWCTCKVVSELLIYIPAGNKFTSYDTVLCAVLFVFGFAVIAKNTIFQS